jgi:hypothetical protein
MNEWNTDFDTENTLDDFILEERPNESPDDPEPLSTLPNKDSTEAKFPASTVSDCPFGSDSYT